MPKSTVEPSDSRWAILEALRRFGSHSVDELVEAVALSKTATRAHLVRMERDGWVTRVDRRFDGPGRPPAVFALTEQGARLFPTAESELFGQLIGFLEQNGGALLVEQFFEDLWARRESELWEQLPRDAAEAPLDARLTFLEQTLRDQNFYPVVERRMDGDGNDIVRIRECNCPLPAAARASQRPCHLEVAFLSRVLGTKPRRVSIAESRVQPCVFEFALPSE